MDEQLPNPAAPPPAVGLPEPAPSPGVAVAAAPAEPSPAPTADPAADPATVPAEGGDPKATADPASEPTLLEKFGTEEKKPDPAAVQPAEVKPGEQPAQPAAPAPVTYEYTLPETLKMDDTRKGEFHTALDGFRADAVKGAQGLIDLHNKGMQEYADFLSAEQHRIFNETRKGWVNEVMADEQLGGSGHRTAMGAIARMRDQFVAEADRPAFENFLRITGAGDHPQFLKLMHNVSRFYDEPPLPPPNPKPTPNNGLPPKRGMSALYNRT